jgi:hypothetical protein
MFIFKIYLASNDRNMMMPEDKVCSYFRGREGAWRENFEMIPP